MDSKDLTKKKVAFLVADGFEQSEFIKPWDELKKAGAEVYLISINRGQVQGYHHQDPGDKYKVDQIISEVSASDYDALVLPGGLQNPDTLRLDKKCVQFVKDFFAQKKPVAAICHGPWLLVEADVVRGRTLTSWPSLRTDIKNAGGTWVDEEVHVDQGLVTSRKPDDLQAFCRKTIEEIWEGVHK